MPYLIELGTAVCAEYHSRQYWHLTHRCEPASSVTDALDDIEGFLINDCFMGVLENLPLRRIIMELLLLLIGLAIGLEVDRMPEVFLPCKNMRDCTGSPVSFPSILPVVRWIDTICFCVGCRVHHVP